MIAGYIRISRKSRDKIDTSPEFQKKLILKIAKRIDKEYIDIDKSGKETTKRPAFNQLIQDAKAGLITKIYFKDWSRLFRNLYDQEKYVRLFKELNIELIPAVDTKDTTMRQIQGIFNEKYIRDLQKKTNDTHNILIQQEIPIVPTSYGYEKRLDVVMSKKTNKKVLKKQWFIKKKESNIVKSIFRDYLNGLNFQQISEKYKISKSKISRILHSKTYLGYFKYKGEWIKSRYIPQIIDERTYNKVQELLNKNKIFK